MSTLNFLDANVWLALLWRRHTHAQRAATWADAAGDERFLYCRFTQITVLRLLTTERVMAEDTQSMAGAWAMWERATGDARVGFVNEPDDLQSEFRSRSQLSTASPKLWADAYLSAFATASGLKLVTFDKALKAHGADVLIL